MLSHEHLDHRGGLNSLLKAWPELWIRSPLGWQGHLPCRRGESWRWRGLTFRVLWPPPDSGMTGNNRSCVVRIDDGKQSILLTGDIEIPAERAMMSHYWQYLASTLIRVPHHGSNTSSSLALLQRTGGAAALASASRYNTGVCLRPKWYSATVSRAIDGSIRRIRDKLRLFFYRRLANPKLTRSTFTALVSSVVWRDRG